MQNSLFLNIDCEGIRRLQQRAVHAGDVITPSTEEEEDERKRL